MNDYELNQAINNAPDILNDSYLKRKKAEVNDNSPSSKFEIKEELELIPQGDMPTIIRKPNRFEFFRTYLDMGTLFQCYMLEIKENMDATYYRVSPDIAKKMRLVVKHFALQIVITHQGNTFVWPLKTNGKKKGGNSWNTSAWKAATVARYEWVKILPNFPKDRYELMTADENKYPAPQWPLESYGEMLDLALSDYDITTMDHQVLKDFRGAI